MPKPRHTKFPSYQNLHLPKSLIPKHPFTTNPPYTNFSPYYQNLLIPNTNSRHTKIALVLQNIQSHPNMAWKVKRNKDTYCDKLD